MQEKLENNKDAFSLVHHKLINVFYLLIQNSLKLDPDLALLFFHFSHKKYYVERNH